MKKEESRKPLTYGTFSEALQDGLALGFAAFAALRRKNHDPGRWEEPPEHKKSSTVVEDFALQDGLELERLKSREIIRNHKKLNIK